MNPNETPSKITKERLASENQLTLFWGMGDLPFTRVANRHFLVIGSTGSGKTITLRLLMQSVLPWITNDFDHRALIFDVKRDMMAILSGMRLAEWTTTLDPFDKRGKRWDIAKDVNTPGAALQVASILIPSDPGSSQPFFVHAARHILYGVMLALLSDPGTNGQWTLRDILLIVRNPKRILACLEKTEETREIAASYAAHANAFADIHTTILSKTLPYNVVAALWDGAEPFNLNTWLRERGILVLANHPAYSEATTPINQAIFERFAQLVLAESDVEGVRKTWVFLDEVREAGRLDRLRTLLNAGRSKGVCVVLGFQDIDGLRNLYEKGLADEILGQCGCRTYLRTDSYPTAHWIEQRCGRVQQIELLASKTDGYSPGGSQHSTTVGEQRHVRDAVLASEIMGIPETTLENGFAGYHDLALLGRFYRTHSNLEDVLAKLSPLDKPADSSLHERALEAQCLKDWNTPDNERLGLPSKGAPRPEALPQASQTQALAPSGVHNVKRDVASISTELGTAILERSQQQSGEIAEVRAALGRSMLVALTNTPGINQIEARDWVDKHVYRTNR